MTDYFDRTPLKMLDGELTSVEVLRRWLDMLDGSHAPAVAAIISDSVNVNTENSTNIPLEAGGVWTGTGIDALPFAEVTISIYADVPSATDGIEVQFSFDNIEWHTTDEFTHLGLGKFKTWKVQRVARYFRLKYTNGTTTQVGTHFHITCLLSKNVGVQWSHRVKDDISGEDDAGLIRAILAAEVDTGVYSNIAATSSGNLRITDAEDGLAIAKGDVIGHSFIHKFGAAPDFDQADLEVTIWDGAEDGATWELMSYIYSTSAIIDSVSSSDNGDTQDVEIQGLDANYDVVTQTITLTGQTRKALDTNLIRVFRIKNISNVNLAGHVIVYEDTPLSGGVPILNSKIRAVVNPENNQTEMCLYTIPAGFTGYMRSWYASTAGASRTTDYLIRLKARPFGQVFQLKHKSSLSDGGTTYIHHQYVEPEVFAGKTDIQMTCELTAAGVTGATIAAGFDIVLVAD